MTRAWASVTVIDNLNAQAVQSIMVLLLLTIVIEYQRRPSSSRRHDSVFRSANTDRSEWRCWTHCNNNCIFVLDWSGAASLDRLRWMACRQMSQDAGGSQEKLEDMSVAYSTSTGAAHHELIHHAATHGLSIVTGCPYHRRLGRW